MKKTAGLIVVLAMSSQSAVAFDVSLSGPGGEVLLYYKDGNDIVVKNCGNNSPVIQTRSDCSGQENRVPLDVFKENLMGALLLRDSPPQSPTQPFVEVNAVSQKKNQFQAQLDHINNYIQINENGNPDADAKATRDQLQKELAGLQKQLNQNPVLDPNSQARKAAVQRANALISNLVDQEIASSAMKHVAVTSTGQDKLTYSLLKNFDPTQPECGTDDILNGTYDNPDGTPHKAGDAAWLENFWVNSANASVTGGLGARMKSCAKTHYCPTDAAQRGLTCITKGQDAGEVYWTNPKTGQKVTWKLIARRRDPHTGEYHEVWQDSHTLKLWGDTLDGTYSHDSYKNPAVAYNLNGTVSEETACAPKNDPKQSAVAKAANAGVDDKSWGLPTIEEFQQANDDGITKVLPNMNNWFWSSSLGPYYTGDAQDFYGYNGDSDSDYPFSHFSVRCVGR